MIRIGIAGYGNLGRGVEAAVRIPTIWSLQPFSLAEIPRALR